MVPASLIARHFPQLPQWFKRILNESAATHHESSLAFHAHPEWSFLTVYAEARSVQRRPARETLAFRRGDCCRADPFQFARDCSIALIRKSLEEKAHPLSGGKPRHARLLQQEAHARLTFGSGQLAKLAAMLHDPAGVAMRQ